jgi:hypothetical protein
MVSLSADSMIALPFVMRLPHKKRGRVRPSDAITSPGNHIRPILILDALY